MIALCDALYYWWAPGTTSKGKESWRYYVRIETYDISLRVVVNATFNFQLLTLSMPIGGEYRSLKRLKYE